MKKSLLFFIFFSICCLGFSQFPPLISAKLLGSSSICALSPGIYSIAPVEGATVYSWSFPFSWHGSSSSNTILITPNSGTGTITVTTTNSNGQIVSARLPVNVVDCNSLISKFGIGGFDGVVDVFPNSSFGKFFVDYNGDKSDLGVSITNQQGQEIYNRNLRPDFKNEINLAGKKGMFFLKVYHSCGYLILIKKIIVIE